MAHAGSTTVTVTVTEGRDLTGRVAGGVALRGADTATPVPVLFLSLFCFWSYRMSVRFLRGEVCLCTTPVQSQIDFIVASQGQTSHTGV